MPRTEQSITGRVNEVDQDSVTGLMTQDPDSTNSTLGGLAVNDDVAVGTPFTLIRRIKTAAELKTPTTYTANFFSKNAPFKFRVVGIRFQVQTIDVAHFTDGDGGNLDLTVHHGDGAASESFNDILADQVLDDDYATGTAGSYPSSTVAVDPDYCTVDTGESLRAQLIADPDDTISGGAGADSVEVDVIMECVRVV